MKANVVLEPQPEGGYTAFCPVFPGCVSEGESREEAVTNFLDALEGWLAVKSELAQSAAPSRQKRELVEVAL
ncbi:MAG: type II toxin-antitoxin system HicB family antitoxin [Armatimonadetes bacterium CG_4_10_14_3_um_filter_66_18]|nr:type II toxin-antitoxin system HicB family antitoxin [Armatimonadota bacterium]OIP10723.1 MAG: hypothetical protein AUJ96_03300 [Armatimonadetes bacterium CG2_30_66_41]PIU94792.1 MAG: type II toxin-antitoxin system HicB family antitoxin [Armatimonadetes bacterium CG06_land_8_20_14_3_00_66_21]PIW14369.1 MAG: type II toxin-antitoxin system HicB family antitoxin [Armatimonadetes bacterium CG17_big_fil_post_rev_8_21_14_2_50_66_6]PIX36738.1 MAG: type II toxin-antitoxin system HicB family antitoxi